MEIQSLKLVYFSPTGTTKAIAHAIARGIALPGLESVDITTAAARKRRLRASEGDLLVVAVPVYMGRVPALLSEWLNAVSACATPAVCVVVYGNRAFENSLLELKDILTARGCVPIAGAAYIGEHSFSGLELPTAAGRPDASDLGHAERFGRNVSKKLRSVSSGDQFTDLEVSGAYPYGGVTELWNVDFIEVDDRCTQCGVCAAGCPVEAIDAEDSRSIDIEKCVTCCACIKNCPEHARAMKPGQVEDVAKRLFKHFHERKDPVCFL